MTPVESLWASGIDDAQFWEYCRRRELRFQTCTLCSVARHPPHPVCPHCGSTDFEYRAAPKSGRIYSFTIVRTVAHEAFADQAPYCIAIVVFPGLRDIKLVTRILDARAEMLSIGMELTIQWVEHGPRLVLPCFVLRSVRIPVLSGSGA